MYIPPHNIVEDQTLAIEFMQVYPFAQLISVIDHKPYATSLPFLIQKKGDDILLRTHCAKANIHAQYLSDQTHLVIFQEPHAFITTKDYIRPSVPTWNYVSIHAYGPAQIIQDEKEIYDLIMEITHHYQPDYDMWDQLPEHKQKSLLKGIICFDIVVTDLQSKFKLSQNITKEEQINVADRLLKMRTPQYVKQEN